MNKRAAPSPIVEAIAAHFGVQTKQAEIVAALYAAGGAWVEFERLRRTCGIASQASLKVHASWLRTAGVMLDTKKHLGYALGQEARDGCGAALLTRVSELRRAANDVAEHIHLVELRASRSVEVAA